MSQKKAPRPSSWKKIARIFVSMLPALAATSLCLAAGALLWAEQALKLNTYYQCNGQRIVVLSCVDQSDKDYNDCIVQFPDRPVQANGQHPGTFVLRRNLVNTIQQCKELGAAAPSTGVPGGAPGPGPRLNPTSQSSMLSSAMNFAENGLAILFIAVICLGVLGLVGWWAYKKIYYSRYLSVRRNNKEALEEFGADQATRERNIVEAFNSGDYPLKLRGENRNKNYMMTFVLTKPVGTFKRQDLECIRFAYFVFNRGLIDEERFYTYRITAMYQGGMTDPSEFDYIGWLAFWHRRKKQGEIGRARGAVQGFAAANCTPNLQNQTFAALQSLMAKYPNDEFFMDMWQRFRGGARWLGLGDIKRSAFAVPERPSPYYVQFGTLDGTSTMLTYSGDGSILTVAPPGQGKTTCNVIPNLLRWPGAAIVLDVKGEIYDLTSQGRNINFIERRIQLEYFAGPRSVAGSDISRTNIGMNTIGAIGSNRCRKGRFDRALRRRI